MMTPDARKALSTTIRRLRAELVEKIDGAALSRWRPSLRVDDLAPGPRRERLRFEETVAERVRASGRSPADVQAELVRLAASTWVNRVVFMRIFEVTGPAHLKGSRLVTGYKGSPAYTEFLGDYAGALGRDETLGYLALLRVVFDELSLDLPGLFGRGLADLLPFPPSALNAVIEAVNDPALESCWTDDTTPGWIYQYWNDPDREALDDKLAAGKKLAPHEIASKTQMFTERYMVEWLLHNSLGPAWLGICDRNGWVAEVLRDGVLSELDSRRGDWREKRESGVVPADALMPLHGPVEPRWAYYVPHERSPAGEELPVSVRGLRILDPACGSGHFLVIAFDLLVALYEEEARHRGLSWSRREIGQWILEDNLHGVDLDPRAVQIAAAALWVKARGLDPAVAPQRMNLVAADLGLSRLPASDPARRRLVEQIRSDTGLKESAVDAIWRALADVDHLGTLLKVDVAVREAIAEADAELFRPTERTLQGKMFDRGGKIDESQRYGKVRIGFEEALDRVQARVKGFLAEHTGSDELGLRLSGEQLAAGLRFLEVVREGQYHLVVGNPPYQGTAKMADPKYVQKHYPRGKADLYAAFIERALQLCVPGGVSALVTMRNWMFISQYQEIREWLLTQNRVALLGDLTSGAFEAISPAQVVVSVVMFVVRRGPASPAVTSLRAPRTLRENSEKTGSTPALGGNLERAEGAAASLAASHAESAKNAENSNQGSEVSASIALRAFDEATVTQPGETERKRAAVLAQVGRFEFRASAFEVVPGRPVVYWWDSARLQEFVEFPLLGNESPVRQGLATSNNARFLRQPWEIRRIRIEDWAPFIKGGEGRKWIEPLSDTILWRGGGLEVRAYAEYLYGSYTRTIKNEQFYFRNGVAFVKIGAVFDARKHRFPSVIDVAGSSAYPESVNYVLCGLNQARSAKILQSLNPTVNFQVGDLNRLPMIPIESADEIVARLDAAFTLHESHREPSVEFRSPGPSPWEQAQAWAQLAVDREAGAPLPVYHEVLVAEPPTDHLSFALGVCLGRFGADGSGVLDPATADLSGALPGGILFLDGAAEVDDLDGAAAAPLREAWRRFGAEIDGQTDVRSLREWLRLKFFAHHKATYDNRPIHWPLSSSGRTFVAWVNIHRMGPQTLTAVLTKAEAALLRLRGRTADLRGVRDGGDVKAGKTAEKALILASKQLTEVEAFVADLRSLANRGAPPPSTACPAREVDAPYDPDLDDGVMVNSAALWPLLEPQWKDPKKWWIELAKAEGRKDYDWSHLAARYWPTRVGAKAQVDPSLGVAHRCFWRHHPARAFAWELRLQDEIGPDFLIDEPDAAEHRERFLREQPLEVAAIRAKEEKRRARKRDKEPEAELFEEEGEGE